MASKKTKNAQSGPWTLTWDLANLPTTQHRAGLAGLYLFSRWLDRQPTRRGTFDVTGVTARTLTLRADAEGLGWAFDELYAADTEETRVKQPWRDQ